ncbi:MAG TPA: hypothetical protein VE842_12430 [Pyrinomonadaceae bacterium]|jgi:hypothetical protein|nr:hypothetical protein [Pyrinomonadaceae bacterium]
MTFRSPLRFALLLAALFVFGGSAYAQGPAVGSATTTSELEMSATVQTAVQLNISTGAGGATVSGSNATGLFQVAFGNVNGLGLGTPAAGVSVVADASGALYKTPINLTPVYSGFTTETATIEVEQDAAGDTALAREGNSSIASASTVSTSTPASVATGGASGVAVERYVGMYVSRAEAAGAKSATLIYTITVE